MNCPNCGAEISNTEKICPICGFDFDFATPTSATQTVTSSAGVDDIAVKPLNKSLKNVIAILSVLLIGMAAAVVYILLNPQTTSETDISSKQTLTVDENWSSITETATTNASMEHLETLPETTCIVSSETQVETFSESNSEPLSEEHSKTQNETTSTDHTLSVYTKLLSENCKPYTLYDIDGNGEYEIILKESWDGEVYENVIYHFYTFHNDELIKLGEFYYDYPMYLIIVNGILHFAVDGMDTYIQEIRMIDQQLFVGETKICLDLPDEVFFYDYKDKSILNYVFTETQ